MPEKDKPAPEAKEAPAPEAKEVKQETIGEVIGEKPEEKPEPKVVPEAAFLELKNANKEMKRELKALRASIEEGASPNEVADSIDGIAEEYGYDKTQLRKLANAIRKEAERDIDEKVSSKLKPIEAKDREVRIETVFSSHFDKTMADMPEFKEIVNRNVIKTLSLDPANANKTFAQLIEETYGNAIRGKRTIETTTHGGGKSNDKIDFKRATSDQQYFKEIMANPDLKKEYNDSLVDRISGVI